ncbi:unnamed protein product [Trichogramma brassicae]|uniref:Uncharacterized protein n=1 Tax=Trichogramma brassicae TaxID=86971 RepID=A0A6H5IKM9_9HYME|nr:unnamed protein product [Trichogramma brassicae]
MRYQTASETCRASSNAGPSTHGPRETLTMLLTTGHLLLLPIRIPKILRDNNAVLEQRREAIQYMHQERSQSNVYDIAKEEQDRCFAYIYPAAAMANVALARGAARERKRGGLFLESNIRRARYRITRQKQRADFAAAAAPGPSGFGAAAAAAG